MKSDLEATTSNCPVCGAPLVRHRAEGFCSRCLARTTLIDEPTDTADEGALGRMLPGKVHGRPMRLRLDDFELIEELARGGMGVVYKARQLSLDRLVALKMLLFGGWGGADAAQRFRTEATAAAALDHPNIVRVLHVGEHEGQPFLAMPYVAGPSLAEALRAGPFPARHAAECLTTVARAVQFAHDRGVLHRDLKPSNILLDAEGVPHVTDFGLAKNLRSETQLTHTGQTLGTPNYIPPEQIRGNASAPSSAGNTPRGTPAEPAGDSPDALSDITPAAAPLRQVQVSFASDVYALGAVLYHALTGRPPFLGEEIAAVLQQVLTDEPVPPRRLNPSIPRDLETICLKCLEKEPARRYSTAQELGDELDRFLQDEPIHAHPITRAERFWRWCRRKPALAASLVLVVVLLLVLGLGGPVAAYRINQARQAEISHRERAQAEARHAEDEKNRAEAATQRAEAETLRARRSGYASDMLLAQQALAENNLGRARELLENYGLTGSTTNRSSRREALTSNSALRTSPSAFGQSLVTSGATDLRGWEWYYLASQVRSDELLTLGTHSNVVTVVAFSPDGKWLVSTSLDGMADVWDVSTRQHHAALAHSGGFLLRAACFSPDGKLFATGADLEKVVRLWRVPQFDLVSTLTTTNDHRIIGLAFSSDGQWIASGGTRGVCLWNLQSREELDNSPLRMAYMSAAPGMAFTPDSRQFLFGRGDGTIGLFDLQLGRIIRTLPAHSRPVLKLLFTPDGQRIFSAGDDGVRCWSASDLSPITHFTNQGTSVIALASDGRTLAVAGGDRRIHLLDAETGEPRVLLRGHLHWITALAWSPDGRTLASGSGDLTVRLWSPEARVVAEFEKKLPMRLDEAKGLAQRFNLSPDGRWLTTGYTNGTFSVWHTETFTESARQPSPFGYAESLAISSEARWLARGGSNGVLRLAEWNPYREQVSTNLGDGRIMHLQFSPDGKRLAVYTWDHFTIRVLTVPKLETIAEFPGEDYPFCMRFTPDGSKLAVGWFDNYASVLDIESPRVQAQLRGHRMTVYGIAISKDGRRVATASLDGTVRLWDATTGRELHSFSGQFDTFLSVTFSPGEDRLLAGTGAGVLHVWNLETWQEVMSVKAHESAIMQLGFLPDQATLISASDDQIRVWRSAPQ